MSARYSAPDQVPTQAWQIQGTVYDDVTQAKFAAARIWASCSNCGVVVKKISRGWTILFWRLGVIK